MSYNSNYKIAGLNLLISQLIISLFLVFAWFIWFPTPFSEITSFYKAVQMIVLVNICLGPLLIFIIYKKDKKHLKLDLSVLAIIQLSAFIFGAYSLYLKHPVYAVFTVDRFTLINAKMATSEKIQFKQLKSSFFSSTKLVYAKRPDNIEERKELLFSVLFEGKPDLDRRPEYYEPFDNHLASIFARSINTKNLFTDEVSNQKLANFLKKYGGAEQDYAFFPLQGSTDQDVIWILDKKSGKPVDIIKSDPWQVAKR